MHESSNLSMGVCISVQIRLLGCVGRRCCVLVLCAYACSYWGGGNLQSRAGPTARDVAQGNDTNRHISDAMHKAQDLLKRWPGLLEIIVQNVWRVQRLGKGWFSIRSY